MTPLRRMSGGQLITALSFVASGIVQYYIEADITPVPSYHYQNSIMVLNANVGPLTTTSPYWSNEDLTIPDGAVQKEEFILKGVGGEGDWRTPTFSWIDENIPYNVPLAIGGDSYVMNPSGQGYIDNLISIQGKKITAIVSYTNSSTGELEKMEYHSSYAKSDSIRVKSIIVNPSRYWVRPRLIQFDYKEGAQKDTPISGNDQDRGRGIVPIRDVLQTDAEFDQGIYKMVFDLYENGNKDDTGKGEVDEDSFVMSCQTGFIWDGEESATVDDLIAANAGLDEFKLKPGSIWTFMVREIDDTTCEILYDQDSNSNNINIFWLIPQYVILTIGEVMNSATGLEFAYTQAPPSMKSVVQAFWLLTTCIGNLIDVFLVEIDLWPTQTGEYFILAIIMFCAAMLFVFLSMFYYEYVPEDAFSEDFDDIEETNESKPTKQADGAENDAYDEDEL